jgi:hypothetical protein
MGQILQGCATTTEAVCRAGKGILRVAAKCGVDAAR